MSNTVRLVVTEVSTLLGQYNATGAGINNTGLWKGIKSQRTRHHRNRMEELRITVEDPAKKTLYFKIS